MAIVASAFAYVVVWMYRAISISQELSDESFWLAATITTVILLSAIAINQATKCRKP